MEISGIVAQLGFYAANGGVGTYHHGFDTGHFGQVHSLIRRDALGVGAVVSTAGMDP